MEGMVRPGLSHRREGRTCLLRQSPPLADWAVPSAPSAEELLLEADGTDTARAALIQRVRNDLTEKQYRRLRLYYLEGLSEREIARLEGVGQQRVSRSIRTGKKAMEKIFLEIFGHRG